MNYSIQRTGSLSSSLHAAAEKRFCNELTDERRNEQCSILGECVTQGNAINNYRWNREIDGDTVLRLVDGGASVNQGVLGTGSSSIE